MRRPTGTGWPVPKAPAPAATDQDSIRYDSLCLIKAQIDDNVIACAAIVYLGDAVALALDLSTIAAEFVQAARGTT
jgi:small basic protein